MYISARRQREEKNEMLEESISYPQASIREYLNVRRVTKDKCCLISFCSCLFLALLILGLAFFYGNYSKIGVFVSVSGPTSSADCPCSYLEM